MSGAQSHLLRPRKNYHRLTKIIVQQFYEQMLQINALLYTILVWGTKQVLNPVHGKTKTMQGRCICHPDLNIFHPHIHRCTKKNLFMNPSQILHLIGIMYSFSQKLYLMNKLYLQVWFLDNKRWFAIIPPTSLLLSAMSTSLIMSQEPPVERKLW